MEVDGVCTSDVMTGLRSGRGDWRAVAGAAEVMDVRRSVARARAEMVRSISQ